MEYLLPIIIMVFIICLTVAIVNYGSKTSNHFWDNFDQIEDTDNNNINK